MYGITVRYLAPRCARLTVALRFAFPFVGELTLSTPRVEERGCSQGAEVEAEILQVL